MPSLAKPKDRRCLVCYTRLTASEAKTLIALSEQEAMSLSDLIRAKLFPRTVEREEKSLGDGSI